MFPAQTSLIPVQIALARFLEQGSHIFANYPYWYLGTTPFRYLTGPVLPLILILIHQILPNFSLFEIMFGVILMAWLVGGVGVFKLIGELGRMRENEGVLGRAGAVTAFFYLFGPIMPFLFRFSDGRYLIAFSFLPMVLWQYLKLLKNWTTKQAALVVFLMSFVMLTDTLILPSLILGMAAILLATTGWGKIEKLLKKSVFCLLSSVFLCTLWYTPGYWPKILLAPSFGGKGTLVVIEWLGKLLPTVLALVMAVFSVKFFKKKNPLRDFCFYWLFTFGFLTLIRFLSDPDFWLDWSSYGLELQFGLAMLGGYLLGKQCEGRRQNFSVFCFLFSVLIIYLLLFTVIFNKYVIGTLQTDITKTVEYRIGQELAKIVKPGEKVFLSGSTVFWLNAFFNIPQVRGGVDQVSVDKNWRQAAWEIREGADTQKSLKWLKDLKINYLVVHTQESAEFYHDFMEPEKFEGVKGLAKIYDKNGDKIYKVGTLP